MTTLHARRVLELLPWRQPFLMIDGVVLCTPGERIVTIKHVSAGEPAAAAGWLPSMLLLEGMGQTAALLFRLSRGAAAGQELPLLGFLKAELHGSARVGESITFDVRSQKMTTMGGVFDAEAHVAGACVAQAQLAFAARTPD